MPASTIKNKGFVDAFSILVAAYPNKDVSKATARLYYEMLSDYEADLMIDAVKEVIKLSKYFPTISEIIEKAEELKLVRDRVARGLDPETGLEIWRTK